jgi:hypothetical protein
MVIQNPMFQPLNIVFSSTQLTATNPNIGSGLVFQGSCLVNTVINNVQASTSGQTVNAYQVTVTVFNFMSLMLLFLPIIIYMYYEYHKSIKPIKKLSKRKVE